MGNQGLRSTSAWAAILAALSASSVHAQQAPSGAAADTGGTSDIVVTAQKRTQSLQDVPISISVIGGEMMAQRGQDDFAKVTRGIPGISFIDMGPGQSQLSIRGINTGAVARDDTARKESVGVYLNETPVSVALFNPDLDTYDLARVEVLRGPQGTLYGAGSLAGTVRLISNQPDSRSFAASGDGTLSFTRDGGTNYALKEMINLPISRDLLALRVVGYSDYTSGYVDNIALGRNDVNDARKYGVRAALRFTPDTSLTITPSVVWQHIKTGGFPIEDVSSVLAVTTNPALVASLPTDRPTRPDPLVPGQTIIANPTGGSYTQYRQVPEGLTDDFKVYNLEVEYDLGGVGLTSSSSYLDRDLVARRDFTYFVNTIFGGGAGYSLPTASLRDQTRLKTFVQELRLASKGAGPFSWIAGVYYQHEDRDYAQSILSDGFEGATGIPASSAGLGAGVLYLGTFALKLRQYAMFGEASYKLTDTLSATAGLRWFDYSQTRHTVLAGLFNDLAVTDQNVSTQASGFNPKFLLSYKPTRHLLVSAQASRGFKLGGPTDPVPGICAADAASSGVASGEFKPETLWNYELGVKSDWAGGRLTINGALFQMDYTNLQLNRRLACSFTVTTNGGKARSRGVELEISARPFKGLELSLGGSYIDAVLQTDEPSLNAAAGDSLPLSPRFTANGSARYTAGLSASLDGYADFSWQHVGGMVSFFNSALAGAPPVDPLGNSVPAYDIFNLRLGVTRGPIELSLFADNLFDKRAAIAIDRERVGFITEGNYGLNARTGLIVNQPRTIGINLKVKI
jgi:iron complex outermembrane receptor protein